VRPMLFWSIGIFVLEMLTKLGNCLNDWLGILMNLRLVILILPPHPPVSLILRLLRMRSVIVLTMTVILVPIIFLLMVLPGLLA